ncbi:MAG: hypothetical protein H6651_13050 [Ardenticatenales bacterium]|nr:hypothetical protein [Ardenticatenales bacterium]
MSAPQQPNLPIDADFPVELANDLARREVFNKHHYRPNSYLHKWWARRCGTTFRLILKGLVEDEALRDFLAPAGLQGKIILDPMLGGGTTLHEAIRLGANVVGADIDPIPVLQARATLTQVPLAQLEAAYQQLTDGLWRSLGAYFAVETLAGYMVPLRFMLYGVRRACACGPAIQLDSLDLRPHDEVRVDPERLGVWQGDRWQGAFIDLPAGVRLIDKRSRHCASCGEKFQVPPNLPYREQLVPLVTVAVCPEAGVEYRPVSPDDQMRLAAAQLAVSRTWQDAAFVIPPGPKSRDLHYRGIDNYRDLFSPRQQLYLWESRRLLAEFPPEIRLNLGLLISTSLEFNSLLCGYKGGNAQRPGAIRHVFAHHAYGFPYTVVENNPLFEPAGRKASGTLGQLFHDRIRRARQWAAAPAERVPAGRGSQQVPLPGEKDGGMAVLTAAELAQGQRRFLLHHGSAVDLPLPADSIDYVITDPPYFDSVQYGDLANFFRVWLQQLLPEAADWQYELDAAAIDPREPVAGAAYDYLAVLGGIFSECQRVLRPDSGRLIFTFHHGKATAWAALAGALRQARFQLVNYYVVHSESPASVHINGLNALTHDAILVLAPAVNREWQRPGWPAHADSEQFTATCARMLGWSLSDAADETDLPAAWQALLSSG